MYGNNQLLNSLLFCYKFYLILLFFLYIHCLHGSGFLAGTLVKTPTGYVSIEKLSINDKVLCYDFKSGLSLEKSITHTRLQRIKKYIQIDFDNESLCVAPDQELYLSNKQSIQAHHILKGHSLLKNIQEDYSIKALQYMDQEADVYDITVDECHNFYVTHQDICVHNFIPIVIGFSFVFGGGAIKLAGISAAVVTVGAMIASLLSRDKRKTQLYIDEQSDKIPDNGGQKKPDEPEKDEDLKYVNAPHHHQNSNGKKSPAPTDGQAALDTSVEIGGESKTRVSVNNNEIVVLNRTQNNEYHGHVRTWRQLESEGKVGQKIMNALIKNGLVNNAGKH